MRLKLDNKPKEDGKYVAGNINNMHKRIEFESVTVQGSNVFTKDDLSPFIFSDFDYWSDKLDNQE